MIFVDQMMLGRAYVLVLPQRCVQVLVRFSNCGLVNKDKLCLSTPILGHIRTYTVCNRYMLTPVGHGFKIVVLP